jgi:organic hydroperoxide reductase OsmC/OhrA
MSEETGSHRFTAQCTWEGSTADGYERYDRTHRAAAPPAEALLSLASAPEFRGDPRLLNPEQLLVLAASSCQLLAFLAVAARARIEVVRYEDDAEGVMPTTEQPMWITRIVLRPRITVRSDVDDERLSHLCEVAHHECFIASSLRTEVVVEPTFFRG